MAISSTFPCRLWLWPGLLAGLMMGAVHAAEPADSVSTDLLLRGLRPLVAVMTGRESQFRLTGSLQLPVGGQLHQVDIALARYDDESFDLALTHADYAVAVRRRESVTALALPRHQVVFLGRGEISVDDRLSPAGITRRLFSDGTKLAALPTWLSALALGDADASVGGLLAAAGLEYDAVRAEWSVPGRLVADVPGEGRMRIRSGQYSLTLLTETATVGEPPSAESWPEMRLVELGRDELERTLLRGLRRAAEIAQPSEVLKKPAQVTRTVPNGQLLWKDGQRVALLRGTPEEIGTAHGQLLPEESMRCIESVLYAFGTVSVVRTGRWFRHDLEAAYERLAPHIPDHHKRETRALAAALSLPPELVEVLNVFPELFHCSGFAVFGSATADGRLYHGRVLDYMTTIGLQDAATTFVVQADGRIPFVNVGYAGFIGSVSGMNADAVSLGEMGGRGEGAWDGAPMATLMRRALEECHTLHEVRSLWTHSPRTCEYYYVFADGKTNEAVGVAATPESLEFIEPGQSHDRLGSGIPDAVVLSAGSRLDELRRRIIDHHGRIDADVGQWLMSRPVAMQSNLHNVLFVPQDRVLYVANASHDRPAAETPYICLSLDELLNQLNSLPPSVVTGP